MDTMSPGSAARALPVAAAVAVVVVVVVCLLGVAILRLGGPGVPDAAAEQALAPAPSAGALVAPRGAADGASRSSSRPLVDQTWLNRIATAAGIPAPAVRAYADAELVLRSEQPGCRLSWNTLAGIGWVESQHGTVGGGALLTDGRSSQPILGPALDGTGAFAAIRSTRASAAWHGDALWEHAVGPLQFLASTWERWGADADGDGAADPGDLDDAALAAGRYLCADGHDLSTDSGWNAAIRSYNHDARYVANVAAAANSYLARTG